jgi:hypothetical protein
MADDFLDKVFADTAPAEEAPIQEPEAAVEPAPETVEEPQPQPQPEVAAEPQRPEPGYVPLNAVLEEREKRQAAERRIAEFEAQAKQPQVRPDAFDDPEGYDRHIEQQIEQRVQKVRADTSYALAVRDYGKDTVEEARAWALDKAQKDPMFNQQVGTVFATEMLPVDWVVQQHKREALLADIGDPSKLDDWFSREAAKRGYAMQSTPPVAAPVAAAPAPAPKPAMPPRSIASDATPAAAAPNTDPMAAMDAIFKR